MNRTSLELSLKTELQICPNFKDEISYNILTDNIYHYITHKIPQESDNEKI